MSPDNFSVNISPNPLTETSDINIYLDRESSVSVKLMSIQGKIIREILRGNLTGGSHRIRFNKEGLSKGIYLCKVSVNDKIQTVKIVVPN